VAAGFGKGVAMSMKMMKWIAAGVLAGAPAIALARSHVTAAPLAAISSVTSKVTPSKLAATHKKPAVKHKQLASKSHPKVTHTAVHKTAKHKPAPKVSHKNLSTTKKH
jgi:hypothetical protein